MSSLCVHYIISCLQVAYHGVPEKAYEVFVNALQTRYLELGLIIPELEDRNPAGNHGNYAITNATIGIFPIRLVV